MNALIRRTACFVALLLALSVHGQTVYDVNGYLKMPVIASSSPNAASIERFGNIPVDYSTGVPSIGIPIWTIKCGNVNWPITLSYHAAGIKVDETASSVGLGWALTGPGVISRAVIGKRDEFASGEPSFSGVTTSDWSYLFSVKNGLADSEMDLFTYNFNGKSGKFLIKQDGTIFQIPYTNMKFAHNGVASFTITDENGVVYIFDQQENSRVDQGVTGIDTYTSSWYLSKVTSSDTRQSIDFTYIPAGNSVQVSYNYSQSIGTRPTQPNGVCGGLQYAESFSGSPTMTFANITNMGLLLSQISFPNGSISLNYVNDRIDIGGSATGRLSSISIFKQPSSILLQKFQLYQSDFFYRPPGVSIDDYSQHRLRLDSVKQFSSDLTIVKPYKFEYRSNGMVPRGNFGQDKWGFNNGKYNNPTLLQSQTDNYVNGNTYNIGNADRSVDTTEMKACMLTAITWPTGGRTVYYVEPHQYNANYNLTTPGFSSAYAVGTSPQTTTTTFTYPTNAQNTRVKITLSKYNFSGVTDRPYAQLKDLTTGQLLFQFANFNPDGAFVFDQSTSLVQGRSYELKAIVATTVSNTQLEARINVEWEINTGTQALAYGGGLRIKEIKNFTSDGILAGDDTYEYVPATPLTPVNYLLASYNDVVYKLGYFTCPNPTSNCLYANSGPCRVYHSGTVYPTSTIGGSPFMYTKVIKYNNDALSNTNGKTEYYYDVIQDQDIPVGGPGIFNVHLMSNEWKNAFLKSQLEYKRNGTTYQLIKETKNDYFEFKSDVTYSLKVYGIYIHTGCEYQDAGHAGSELNFFTFPIRSGSKKLIKSTETLIDDNGNQVVTVTNNEYTNPSNDYLTKTTLVDSKGNSKITSLKYANDFSVSGNPYSKMITRNIVSPVIEQKKFNSTTLLSTTKIGYRDWKNDATILMPDTISSSVYSNPLESKIVYADYDDHANTLSVKKESNTVLSYIWNHNFQYPVAEVTNAVQSDIAYTSFESIDKGNWQYSGSTGLDPTAPTGRRYYILGTSITKSGLSTTKTYIVSYWKKTGTVNVNSATPTSGLSVSGWTYYEHKVINPSGGIITISGTSAIIDELRLYPLGAQMTTYTFDPLVGMTSQSDVNNRIITYGYDALQRLMLIRDQDKNILKKFCYNYSGQPENCSIFYNDITQGVYRKSCGQGYVGSLETYTVPAGTYSSTDLTIANGLAQQDLTANGQAYADAVGSCTAGSQITGYNSKQYDYNLTFTPSSGSSYTFLLDHNSSSHYLGTVPNGTYTVTFSPVSTSVLSNFYVGSLSANNVPFKTFYSVVISGNTNAYMY